jgi:phage tail-like protein
MPTTSPGELTDVELVGSWFSVELDNGISGYFSEVSGLAVDVEVIEFTDTAIDTVTRKRPGTTKYNEVTLKRTLSPDKTFWDWVKKIRDGNMDYRTDGAVVVFDMAGDEIGRWTLTNVWPSKWSASDLDVGSDDLMQEDVTLQVEMLERVK